MSTPIPRWLMQRYADLWKNFENRKFDFSEAKKVLKDKNEVLSVVLSQLKKNGWLKIELDTSDARKRIYYLEHPEKVINEIEKNKVTTKSSKKGV